VLSRVYAFGSSSRDGASILDFIVDIANRLARNQATKNSATDMIKFVLETDPNCYRALRTMVDILEKNNVDWLKKLVEVGKDSSLPNIDYYRALLHDSIGPAKSQQHALKIAYHQLCETVPKRFPKSHVDCDLQGNEIQVSFTEPGAVEHLETIRIDSYDITVRYEPCKIEYLTRQSSSRVLTGENQVNS
jgi:hypothetical protein